MIKFKTMYFIILIFNPVTLADLNITSATTNATSELISPCDIRCGCNKEYVYDSIQEKCVVNMTNVTERIIIYNENQDHDILSESRLSISVYREGQKIFKGIMISALFIVSCAAVCVFVACIYCCRINYTDRQLNKEVKALAKKLKRDYKSKKDVSQTTPSQPEISESCNIVVAEAGVYVV